MNVPCGRSKLTRARANRAADEWPAAAILHRLSREHEFSRRTANLLALVLLGCGLIWNGSAAAQDDMPQIMPAEHKLPTKKDVGPRAIAIMQLSSNGKASLVPVAIMIDGKFWDASAYKADPVPMALESGTVYEVEHTGSSQGLFTIGSALHSTAANAQTPWLATGSWVPAGSERKSSALRVATVPKGLTDTDAPPRLTRDPTKVYPEAKSSSSPSSSPSSASAGAPSAGGSGDEPPRLTKPESPSNSTPDASTSDSTPASKSGPMPGSAQNSPSTAGGTSSTKSDNAKTNNRANVPTDDSGADAANRPRLRRGKPAESFADEDIPGYSKPGAAPSAKDALPAASAKVQAPAEPVQLVPAISDAHGPEAHSYAFEWLKGEEEQRHGQVLALAKQQLGLYLKAEAKEEITPEAHPGRTIHRVSTKKPPEPVLENVKMVAYDLWVSNQPVIVFSADAHLPPSASGAPSGPYSNLTYSITIVAYPDIYNNLHKLYAGITDKYHLDVTPRLDLIDAVDADGDGRGELLFRETSDAGMGWVIYRASADSLWKMYDSLNPE